MKVGERRSRRIGPEAAGHPHMERGNELDLFREQCGLAGRLVLLVQGPGDEAGAIHEFEQPFAVLGRGPRADVVLPHPSVALRHLYLQMVDGALFAVDLQSASGTWQGDWPLATTWMAPERPLKVGPWSVTWLAGAGADPDGQPQLDPMSFQPEAHATRPALGLLERIGPDGVRTWAVRPALSLVGRAWTCRTQVRDRDLARHHFALLRTRDGPWVVDLVQREDLRVNGHVVRAAPLVEGDELAAGPLRLTIRRRGTSLAPAPTQAVRPRPSPPTTPDRPGALAGAWLPAPTAPSSYRTVPDVLPTTGPERDELERLAPLMRLMSSHYEQSQQQMMAMFQDVMKVVGQAFQTTQQPAAFQVREELEQLRQLGREIVELKTLLIEQTSGRPRGQTEPAPGPQRTMPPREDVNGTNGKSHRPQDEPETIETPGPTPVPLPVPLDGELTASELHASLSRRLASLQREQNSRWKRLFTAVSKRDP